MIATPGPVNAEALAAARQATLAALAAPTGTAGHQAAWDSLTGLSRGQLLDVAALLACVCGRHDVFLTTPEWQDLAAALGVEP
ncbi:MAG TPA: hypothetical protein VGP91_11910 [Actinoplanes sp.]|nr:hypothetical protein [Actinoplanes sp.]